MHIPGPYSDDTWQWVPNAWSANDTASVRFNRPARVIQEIGVLLAIPLASAAIVGIFLKAAGIY